MWCPPPVAPEFDWHEIEALLSLPAAGPPAPPQRHGIRSFALVVAALVIGGGVLTATLVMPGGGCGAACNAVTAVAGPTADVATRSDASLTEGRSVADPAVATDGPAGATAGVAEPGPMAPVPRRHHRHHHHVATPW